MKNKIKKWKEHVQKALEDEGGIANESAVENILIPAFLHCLGFNPNAATEKDRGCKTKEPLPEIPKDIPDYIIYYGNADNHRIVLEAKARFEKNSAIQEGYAQLSRYFNFMSTDHDKKLGILTDGRQYFFYSNFSGNNSNMDSRPFLHFDISSEEELDDDVVSFLELLQKEKGFPSDEIYEKGKELDHISLFGEAFRQMFLSKNLENNLTKELLEVFAQHQVFSDAGYNKKDLTGKKSLDSSKSNLAKVIHNELQRYATNNLISNTADESENSDVSTPPTQQEIQAYYIVSAILNEYGTKLDEIAYKKYGTYFSIYLQDKKEKEKISTTICQLIFPKRKKQLRINFSFDGLESSKWKDLDLNEKGLGILYDHKDSLKKSLDTAKQFLKD